MNIPAPTARAAELVTIERFVSDAEGPGDDTPTPERWPESAEGDPVIVIEREAMPARRSKARASSPPRRLPKIEIATLPPLTLPEWRDRDLQPPDFVMGHWLTTTSRVLST